VLLPVFSGNNFNFRTNIDCKCCKSIQINNFYVSFSLLIIFFENYKCHVTWRREAGGALKFFSHYDLHWPNNETLVFYINFNFQFQKHVNFTINISKNMLFLRFNFSKNSSNHRFLGDEKVEICGLNLFSAFKFNF